MTYRRLRTWKQIAFPAIIFIIISTVLFGEALLQSRQLTEAKEQPCRMTVSAGSASDLTSIAGLQGVDACTEVYTVSSDIVYEIYTGDFTILGVDAGFIEGKLISGALYPDETAMPYLVMNTAAVKAFSKDPSGKPSSAAAGSGQQDSGPPAAGLTDATVTLGGTYARICGIVDDESTAPMVCMSCSAARQYLLSQGTQPQSDTVWLRLTSAGASDSVSAAVSSLGCSVTDTGADTSAWDAMELTIRYQTLSACISLAAAVCTLCASVRIGSLRDPGSYTKKEQILRIALVLTHGVLYGGVILFILKMWER